MDDDFGYGITKSGELFFRLSENLEELGLSKDEMNLILTLSGYDMAPSDWKLANSMGLTRTERIKAMLTRLDSLGLVKLTPGRLVDLSGLEKALDALPDKPAPSLPVDEEDER